MKAGGPLLRCGRRWPTEHAALHSKLAVTTPGVTFEQGRCCGWWHEVKAAPAQAALKPGADTGPDLATRLAVYTRDGWACVCCGTSVVGRRRSVGHRIRRSQGGTNEMPNLLTFLGLGNGLFPDDHHFRIDSRQDPRDHAMGYQLESWQDPAAEGVMCAGLNGSGMTAWLEPDGGLSFEDPALVTGGAA